MARADSTPGCIGWALSQPDGAIVDLIAEMVVTQSDDGRVFGLKEMFEPTAIPSRLFLFLESPVRDPNLRMASIDIVGATIVTLADGRRALVMAKSVAAYTNANGRYTLAMPFSKGVFGIPTTEWPWKRIIAP